MSEKRAFPRRRRRLLVDFVYDGAVRAGFSHDISHTGMFIATNLAPPAGSKVEVQLTLPDGKKIAVTGKVVRTRRNTTSLSQTDPSGFSLELSGYFEPYYLYILSLEAGATPSGSWR